MLGYLFKKNKKSTDNQTSYYAGATVQESQEVFITTDIHSHLLPAIDDGSKSLEESLELIKEFQKLGYKKIITTPHIMGDFYRNTPEIILGKLAELQQYLLDNQIDITIQAAAEYYLDEWFIDKLKNNEKLLTFGKKYLLFETGFLNKPQRFFDIIFKIQAAGYIPVYAHPERYVYLYDEYEIIEKMIERDVLLQVNLNSLAGYYGKPAQGFAEKLIDRSVVSFVGSDCHGKRHIQAMQSLKNKKYYQKLRDLELRNNSL